MEDRSEKIITIPNILSILRIILIPIIAWLYYFEMKYTLAVCVVALSALTDIVDGYIARHFNMTTNVGRILDPIADKLTQAAIIICLVFKFKTMAVLLGVLVIKEIVLGVMGLIVLKATGIVNNSKWYGKLCTGVLYAVFVLHMLIPGMSDKWSFLLVALCIFLLLLSLIMYALRYINIFRTSSTDDEEKLDMRKPIMLIELLLVSCLAMVAIFIAYFI